MKDPKIVEKQDELLELVKGFCQDKLDEEYERLSIKMVEKLGRKRTVPFMSGKLVVWAAGIIHALGTINFLFDKNSQPYATVHDICEFFGTAQSTTSQKSKVIRDLLKLGYFDSEFSTASLQERNPFNHVVSINGLIVPSGMID
ncbi:DUF6398 domain-containing protein [Paenibacillus sp. LHD-38]|uniref:DUF6398 domain-containing protein n=1 Tax=Paenibacillus sp. LHD-38 TaxID=3072143 RepID=UPI00280EE9E4|nr:DUF6398 domain-containing protein [Paenibacillus sp. LHD-38]MDQ8735776.1 DUF6398 domain-containing protein [Paenibacillus sp. LHD-38]